MLALFGLVSLSVAMLTASRREAVAQREAALRDAEEARQHAETSSRLKDQFLATLSHELRTPLNAVLGWTSVLVSGRVEAEKVPAALASIQRNALAQKQLVDDLLDTSAIVSGRLRLDPAPIDLADVAAIRDRRGAPVDRGARPSPRGAAAIGASGRRCDAPAPGGVESAVERGEVHARRRASSSSRIETSDGEAQIVVRDNGRGIAGDFLPHVFDPFRQADSSVTRVSGGLGLGLALVRHLVEAHGGRVWVESDGLGQGAAFTVCLPIREPAVDASAAPPEPTSTSEPDQQPCEPPPSAMSPGPPDVAPLTAAGEPARTS